MMKYSIQFQYLEEGCSEPFNYGQDEDIVAENGEFIPIPDVGDSISCKWDGEVKSFKVVSRHFSYIKDWCAVNIVVTDISNKEMRARLQE